MKKKKRKLFTDLADRYRNEPVEPRCGHFSKCGGCMLQDIPYESQLLMKQEYINTLMDGLYTVDRVHPSRSYRYRNRMDMVTAFGKTGLREAGSYKFVVDILACEIMQEKSNSAYIKLRSLLKDVEGYNYLSHKGYLRYIVLREARFTEQLMVNFVVASDDESLKESIGGIMDEADSISILKNSGLADLSFGETLYTLKAGYIEEKFDDLKFRITPNSFFQSNSEIALKMYRIIRDESEGNVLDLYSGVGSISLFAAQKAVHVTAVESVQEAVDTAEINREINGIKNVGFICADAKPFMRTNENKYHTLILDPPRSGINPKIIKYINEMAPEKIIYMSCNPVHFKNDLLNLDSYRLEWLEAFDMFPQTPHLETLALLKRI